MCPLYRHKPTLVEAMELKHDTVINGDTGPIPARKGDFLITGVGDRQYRVERSVFIASYEKYKEGMEVYVPEFEDDLRNV